MSRVHATPVRQYVWTGILAAAVGCGWFTSEGFAGKKAPNPSDNGAANGVAHRVTALEAALADTQDALVEAIARIDLLEDDVTTLEDEVADLEERVAALEDAAAP